MIQRLISIFIHDTELHSRKGRQKIGLLSGWINVSLNLLLFIGKLLVGIISGSVAVTADAFNNLTDMGSSLVTILGFKLSAKPADKKHPFGYGRIEYIAGVVVSVLILVVGFEFIKGSFDQILNPAESGIEFSVPMLIVLVLAIGVKLFMGYLNKGFGKAMGGSETLDATAFDSISDVATTSVALLSLILSQFVRFPLDGYLGVVIAVVVLVGGVRVLLDTISPLLGTPPSEELVRRIKELVLDHEEIVGVHDLIVHNYGPNKILASLHAEVPANSNIIFAHEIIDQAEREISEKLGITVLIHLDPIVIDDKRVNEMREIAQECISQVDPRFTMHDFRMLDGKKQINLIFDVEVPYERCQTKDQIRAEIEELLRQRDAKFHPIITIDQSYIGD